MEYTFTEKEWKICNDFADQVDTSFYATRKQFNNNKRRKDSLIGKLGEFAVWNIYKDKYTDLTAPDVKIYSAKEKSWDFDLKCAEINLHVKSQDIEMGKRYGTSWIFQVGDKEIFNSTVDNQYVAFVSVDLVNKKALIQACPSVAFLHKKKIWAEPKLEKLKLANKVAVYFRELAKS